MYFFVRLIVPWGRYGEKMKKKENEKERVESDVLSFFIC
jgi:hypothetical protein